MPTLARRRAIAEVVSLLYIAFIAAAASVTGLAYLLFPELGALAHDVLTRPRGKWATQPVRLIATPVLAGVAGTLVTRHLPYSVLAILLVLIASLLIITALRSAVAPAISAGVLPLVLGVKDWLYPLSILFGLTLLVAVLLVWRKYHACRPDPSDDVAAPDVDDILESRPRGRSWLAALYLFVTVTGLAAQLTGLRFILFPPLIVMAYEMLGHPETCPWAKRPLSFPVACFLTALGGLAATKFLGAGPLAATCSMACGVVVLRGLDVHMPPALAVGLIPLVIAAPDLRYPLSVLIGTVALTITFLGWRRLWAGGDAHSSTACELPASTPRASEAGCSHRSTSPGMPGPTGTCKRFMSPVDLPVGPR